MPTHCIRNVAAAILAPVFLAAAPAPASWAAEESILAGDAELEAWIGEMQAEILFDAHLERAETLGDKAMERAQLVWGASNDSNVYHHQYVILHTLLATINLRRDHENVGKDALMEALTNTMKGQAILSGADMLTRDEEGIIKVLVDATRARIECRFGDAKAKDRAYNAAIKKLKKIDGNTLDRGTALMAAYATDDKKYENLTPDERTIVELNDMIVEGILEQIRQEGVIARLEGERDYCGFAP
ncbi:MAG: hypothetical protein R3C51_03240 [Parvularculaceae bacterium]